MSTAEILRELPELTRAEREEIRFKLTNLESEKWMDDGLLTSEEKALVEQRLTEHERDPKITISRAVAEEKLKARLAR